MSKARDIASAAPAPSTVSATEIGYLDGVTSAIQTQLDAKTAKSTLTTTGDIYYASAANTPARLGIGTASQILAVNSGATAPEWVAAPSSGGMTLLSTTTLSGATVTISGISQDYTRLLILGFDIVTNFDNEPMRIDLNASGNSHYGTAVETSNTTDPTGINWDNTTLKFGNSSDVGTSNRGAQLMFNLYNYTSTERKFYDYTSNTRNNGSNEKSTFGSGFYTVASAVTSVKFTVDSASYSSGTILIYGVK
jgi:hypothetical protein